MPRRPDPNRRAAILDAAREVFSEHGVREAHVGEIARRAGIAVGTFYLYFEGKEAVLHAIAADLWARAGEVVRRTVEGTLDHDSLRAMFDDAVDAALAAGDALRPIEEMLRRDPNGRDASVPIAPEARAALVAEVATVFRRCMTEGSLPTTYDAEWLADLVVMSVRRVVIACLLGDADRAVIIPTYAFAMSRVLRPPDER